MTDSALDRTNDALAALEKRIEAEYHRAQQDLRQKTEAYFAKWETRDAAMRAQLAAGEVTAEYYTQWRLAQLGRGERFAALRDQAAARMTRANEAALAYVNDATPGIYSVNRNYAAYTIERVHPDVDFICSVFCCKAIPASEPIILEPR